MKKSDNVLIVDSNPLYLERCSTIFNKMGYELATAQTMNEATEILSKKVFNTIYLDPSQTDESLSVDAQIYLLKIFNPFATIRLVTTNKVLLYTGNMLVDEVIEKSSPGELPIAHGHLQVLKTMTKSEKQKHLKKVRLLAPYAGALKKTSIRIDEQGVCGINCLTNDDQRTLKCVTYHLDEIYDKLSIHIGLSANIGCKSGCKFCRNRPWVRQLTADEIIAQGYYGLGNYHARYLCRPECRTIFNLTCESDVAYNLDNCAQAFRVLSEMQELNPSFIMTTIGPVNMLRKLISDYSDIKNLTLYISHFSSDADKRAEYMPGTAGENLEEQRDLLAKFAEINGSTVTISKTVTPFNIDDEDINGTIKLYKDGPFEIKLMPLVPGSLGEAEFICMDDLVKIEEKFKTAGIPCRKRRIIGSFSGTGCGTTLPYDIDLW